MSTTPATSARWTTRLALKVSLLEDLHAGSGLGGAGIDALLARDRQGQPVIRWSHVKGLLIEALRERAQALGKSADSDIEHFFGKPDEIGQGRGCVRGRSLRMNGKSAASSLVWSSTARQPGSRVPLDDTLRRIEYVSAGSGFEGEICVPGRKHDPDPQLVKKLIGRLSRLGGGRSRGAGLVHIDVTENELELSPPQPDLAPDSSPSTDEAWHSVRVVFSALEPVCLAATGYPGNLIPSHSHLSPGTVAGMLTRWALDWGIGALADPFRDGRIVCGPGYPVPLGATPDANLIDAVPIPLSYQSPKPGGQKGSLPWWAAAPEQPKVQDILVSPADEKLKRPGAHDYLVTTDGKQLRRYTCPMSVALRNDAGHSQHGGTKQQLFATEAVAEGTGFVARIAVRGAASKAALLSTLHHLQQHACWLHAGRGGAPLEVVAHAELLAAENANASAGPQDEQAATELRLYVESDLILRAADLRFHTRLDRPAVRALLQEAGVDTAPHNVLADVEPKSESEPCIVRGWNVATGKPRFPAIAIRRGSVTKLSFRDAAAAQLCRKALQEHGSRGFGERTDEGYGCIRVDFAPTPEGDVSSGAKPPKLPHSPNEVLLAEAEQQIGSKGFPQGFKPSRWHALRNAAGNPTLLDAWFEQARRRADKDPNAKDWLDDLKNKHRQRADLLRAIGLRAAKQAQRKERQAHRGEENG